jgi:hypothetical protein
MSLFVYEEEYLKRRGHSKEMAGMASLTREKLLVALMVGDEPNECIKEIRIQVKPVEQVMKENGFESFDCMFMDCEGHEENILVNMNFDVVKPRLIVFEHTSYGAGSKLIEGKLSGLGFKMKRMSHDTLAYL